MEYVDSKELGDVVTFCFVFFFLFFHFLPPPYYCFYFFEGAIYPVIICLEACLFFFFFFSPPVCLNFRFLSSLFPSLSLSSYLFLLLV